MEIDDVIKKKWLDSGMLDDIPESNMVVVLKSYEDLFDYFLYYTGIIKFPDNFDTWCFPLLRTILIKTGFKEIEVKNLIMFGLKTMQTEEYQSFKNQLRPYNNIDMEAHLIDFIKEKYLKEHN